MTEKLLTGTLSLNPNQITKNKEYFKFVSTPSKLYVDKYHEVNDINVSSELQDTDKDTAKEINEKLKGNEVNLTSILTAVSQISMQVTIK